MAFTPPAHRAPEPVFDRRGYYRSPVTMPAYRRGHEPANKGRKFPPEVLSQREVLALIRFCGRGAGGKRNAALIALMWRTGLRISEALDLTPKDIDLDEGLVRVLHGKGNKARTVGIDPAAAAIVADWLERRRELGATRSQPLFCVISSPTIGQRMHSAYVRGVLKDLAVKAGVEKRVHPHVFRHTHAYELWTEGARLDYIQRQLGHSSLSVTAHYVEHLNPAEVVEFIRARSWPGAAEAA